MSDVVEIPGKPGKRVCIGALYDYEADRSRCGACGGLGIPWGGWFSCGDCDAVALVSDGRTFLPFRGEP